MADRLTELESEIAEQIVTVVDASELPVLHELTTLESRWTRLGRGSSMGFGIESAIDVISPAAVVIAIWAGGIVADETGEVAKKRLAKRLRRWTRSLLGVEVEPAPLPLTTDVEELRELLIEYAGRLQIEQTQAASIANETALAIMTKRARE